MRLLKLKKSILLCFIGIFALLSYLTAKNPQHSDTKNYVKVNQGKLFYQKFGSGGTPIIVVHGGPGLDQSYLLPQMLALAKNHTVIFYDQRGSGKSLETAYTPKLINLVQFTEDLEALRKQLGLTKFMLLGHSWGSLLAMQYTLTYPDRVSALMLMSTAPADYKGRQAFIKTLNSKIQPFKTDVTPLFSYEGIKKLSAPAIANLYKTLFSVYFYNPILVNKLTLNMSVESAQGGARVMAIMTKTAWLRPEINLLPGLKSLAVPTLIIRGEQDFTPLWTVQAIATAIPHAELITLKNCGHFPYIEKPTELFAQIDRFTRAHSQSATR